METHSAECRTMKRALRTLSFLDFRQEQAQTLPDPLKKRTGISNGRFFSRVQIRYDAIEEKGRAQINTRHKAERGRPLYPRKQQKRSARPDRKGAPMSVRPANFSSTALSAAADEEKNNPLLAGSRSRSLCVVPIEMPIVRVAHHLIEKTPAALTCHSNDRCV